jgi:hypothetical protein
LQEKSANDSKLHQGIIYALSKKKYGKMQPASQQYCGEKKNLQTQQFFLR